jgi:large subunit ribosomal protein L19
MLSKEIIDQIKPGAAVTVTERIKEGNKERTSNFKGIVLARKHGSQASATFTVRALVDGVGVEKVYPINSPIISTVKIASSPKKIKRSKLYFVRDISKKKSRKKIGLTI